MHVLKTNCKRVPIGSFAALIAQALKTPEPGDLLLLSESMASSSSFSVTVLKQNFSLTSMREIFGALTYCPLYKPSFWKPLLRQFAISSSFSTSVSPSTSLSITRHSFSMPILFLMKLHCSLLVGSSLKNCLQNLFWAVFKRLLTKFLWYLKIVCACSDGLFFPDIRKSMFFGGFFSQLFCQPRFFSNFSFWLKAFYKWGVEL